MNHDMGRTKAEFKALRETLGISQDELAKMLGIDKENIKRWERPNEANPKPFAWEMLDEMAEAQKETVDQAVNVIMKAQEQTGALPDRVQLTYYRDQPTYDAMGRDPGSFRLANANARLVAWELERLGIKVEWSYPDDEDNIYHSV